MMNNGGPDSALEFDDEASRSNALTGVAQVWGSYDPRAARSWALSLPSGVRICSALSNATEFSGFALGHNSLMA